MLDNALDYGITEAEFWNMTFAEIHRLVNSKIRMKNLHFREKAAFDYIQARLIAKGVAIAFGDKSDFPTLEDAYPSVFNDVDALAEQQAKQEETKTQLSVLRFKQFANFHNKKYEEVASDK